MITQEDLDRISDRKVYVMEAGQTKDIFIATGGNTKDNIIYFLSVLVCYGDSEIFYLGKDVDETSPYFGLYISCTFNKIRKPTFKEYLMFRKAMKENKVSYNRKTKEVKKL